MFYLPPQRGESVASTATLCSTQTWVDNIRPGGEEKINKIRNYGTSEVEQHWTKGLENYKNNIFNSVDVTSKPSVCKRDSDLKNHLMADHETLGSSSRWGIDTNCRSQKSNLQMQVIRWQNFEISKANLKYK